MRASILALAVVWLAATSRATPTLLKLANPGGYSFGTAVAAASDGTVVVGWDVEDNAIVFNLLSDCPSETCSEDQTLAPSDVVTANEMYGLALALDRGMLAVGSNHSQEDLDNQGAVYRYDCNNATCVYVDELYAADAATGDFFGVAALYMPDFSFLYIGTPIAIELPLLLIGASGNAGAVYVYVCPQGAATSCVQTDKLHWPGSPAVNGLFGQSVAVSGTRVVGLSPGRAAAALFDCTDPKNCTSGAIVSVALTPYSVTISGALVAIGSPVGLGVNSLVTLFQCPTISSCSLASTLTSSSLSNFFGWNVAALADGNMLIVTQSFFDQSNYPQVLWYNCTDPANCSLWNSAFSDTGFANTVMLSVIAGSSTAAVSVGDRFSRAVAAVLSPCAADMFGPFCTMYCASDCLSETCVAGVCICNDGTGFTGPACDTCPPGFIINATTTNCEPCACDPVRSTSFVCAAETAQCPCITAAAGLRCELCQSPHQTGALCDSCEAGYYGSLCDPCPACQNGGVCADGISGNGSCICVAGTSGSLCATVNCVYAGCQNGGTCQTNGQCTCNGNFTGQFCETFTTSCFNEGCENGGTCVLLAETASYKCSCVAGFTDASCSTATGCRTSDLSCQNEGICSPVGDANNTVQCVCTSNFTGDRCQQEATTSSPFSLDESSTYWLLAAVGGLLLLTDLVLLLYFGRSLGDPSTRKRLLFVLLVRVPLFMFDIFDTVTDVLFLLVLNELVATKPDQALLFYIAIGFVSLPYLVNTLAACYVGFRHAVRSNTTAEAIKWCTVSVLVLLCADLLDALRLVVSFDELYVLNRGDELKTDLTSNVGVFYKHVFGRGHLLSLLLFLFVKVGFKDVPHLVIQIMVQMQLGAINPIVVLSLAATAFSTVLSVITFVFLTIVPVLHHRRARLEGQTSEIAMTGKD